MLAPGSVVQKTDQHTSVIREHGKLNVTVRNSHIAKFGKRAERKTKLSEYINRRGPRNFEKSTKAKILSHYKEFTRIRKSDRKMKHRIRDRASGISSNCSNIARSMRVRMPKVSSNFVPPETTLQYASTSAPQFAAPQSFKLTLAPPPTNHIAELMTPSTSAPMTRP